MTQDPLVEEEVGLVNQVRLAIRDEALRRDPDMSQINANLKDLRDEAIHAHERDLPSLFQQLYVQHSLAARSFAKDLPDMNAPYFGHLVIEQQGQKKDILIGHQTFLDAKRGIKIIDWQKAPLAKLYFNFQEGDPYEIELPGGTAEGRILSRRILTFHAGELLGIKTKTQTFTRLTAKDSWQAINPQALQFAGGAGTATRAGLGTGLTNLAKTDVAAQLDAEQFSIVQEGDDAPLLILGAAGSGKTTVAMHRMAALNRRDPKRFAAERMMCIVPEPGLAHLTRTLLQGLGLGAVRVSTFDDWIESRARYLFRSLPKVVCDVTPSRVARFKRHPALRSAFAELEKRRTKEIVRTLKTTFPYLPSVEEDFRNTRGPHLLAKLNATRRSLEYLGSTTPDPRLREALERDVRPTFRRFKEGLAKLNGDRAVLLTDQSMLEGVVRESRGELAESMVADVIRHSRHQFSESSDALFAGCDLKPIDDLGLDQGTPTEISGSIDPEDFTLSIELYQFYTGTLQTDRQPLHRYEFLLVDEAQELSELELAAIGRSLRADGLVCVAGDAVQQTDPRGLFYSWDRILDALGSGPAETKSLKTSYRCPRPIMNFALGLLGPLAPQDPAQCPRDGTPVRFDRFASEGLAVTTIVDELEGLLDREPQCSAAVIFPSIDMAERVYQGIEQDPKVRLVRDGAFNFQPGIDLCDVTQVKGLEFDYVVLFDVSQRNFPPKDEYRRRLHVAATRAVHQLWVTSVGTQSAIVRDALGPTKTS